MLDNINGYEIEIKLLDESIKFPEELNEKIHTFWNEAQTENPNLWDGDLLYVKDYEKLEDKIILTCKKTKYSHYLYDERKSLSGEFACSSLIGACLLETNDGYYVIGELAAGTSFPTCLQITGGSVDLKDIINGNVDIKNTIIRECKEELNVDLNDKTQVSTWHIEFLSLPGKKIHTYVVGAKGILNMSKNQVQEHYKKYFKYLKENNLEIELGQLHFLEKNNAVKLLDEFKKPKREYLGEILEKNL